MIELKNVSKYYQGKESVVKALDSISIRFDLGEFVVITGESGSGKSTFLNVLSGLDTYEAGEMYVGDEETSHFSDEEWEDYRRKNISFIFQNYNIIDAYTVYQNVDSALMVQGISKEERKKRAMNLIERVGLLKQAHQKASKLSGGEKQRTAIARALAKDAPIIVADEPTGNLDSETSESIIKLLKEVSKDRLVLLVSHNYASKEPYATRHVRLFDGEIVEDRTVRPYEKPGEVTGEAGKRPNRMQPLQQFMLALRNMASMPRKTIFTFMIALFIVFVFALTYGSYVEQTEASAMVENHPNFRNSFEGRLVISRKDGEAMSDDEIDAFESNDAVKAVVPNDPVLDRNFRVIDDGSSDDYRYYGSLQVHHADSLDESNLIEGRMPEAVDEVVMDSEDYEIGEELSIYQSEIWEGYTDGAGAMDVTVVGAIDSEQSYNRRIYFSNAFFQSGRAKIITLLSDNQLEVMHDDGSFTFDSYRIVLDDSLPEDTFNIQVPNMDDVPDEEFGGITEEYEDLVGETMTIKGRHVFDNSAHELDVEFRELVEGSEHHYEEFLFIHPDTIGNLFGDVGVHQVSLITEDRFDATNIQDALSDDYYSVYPAGYSNEINEIFNTVIKLFLGALSVFILVLMYFIAYIALRNVMQSRSKNFVILRSIGARRKELSQSLISELTFTMIIAYLVVSVVLNLNPLFPNVIPDYMRFFTFGNYVFMFFALVILSIFLGLKFNKKIFRRSVISAFRDE
ncbi:MAG: ATP-binding cassette domain-containing protein [Candidatus Izemoplasmataceae bacterium]